MTTLATPIRSVDLTAAFEREVDRFQRSIMQQPVAGDTGGAAAAEVDRREKAARDKATADARKTQGEFIDLFGAEAGARYFAEGLSLATARDKHIAALTAANKSLSGQLATAKASAHAGNSPQRDISQFRVKFGDTRAQELFDMGLSFQEAEKVWRYSAASGLSLLQSRGALAMRGPAETPLRKAPELPADEFRSLTAEMGSTGLAQAVAAQRVAA